VPRSLFRSFLHALFGSHRLPSLDFHSLHNTSSRATRHTFLHIPILHTSESTMTDFMAPTGYGLSAPSSRQDIVSALLSAYGNSFGHGEGSPSTFSPVPADKELPPPPPRSDSLRNKPLPAVERAEQRMSMKFQLRGKLMANISFRSAVGVIISCSRWVVCMMSTVHIHHHTSLD